MQRIITLAAIIAAVLTVLLDLAAYAVALIVIITEPEPQPQPQPAKPIAQRLSPITPSPRAAVAPPALYTLTVVQLRKLAQSRGLRSIGGTRASKANKEQLIYALA